MSSMTNCNLGGLINKSYIVSLRPPLHYFLYFCIFFQFLYSSIFVANNNKKNLLNVCKGIRLHEIGEAFDVNSYFNEYYSTKRLK